MRQMIVVLLKSDDDNGSVGGYNDTKVVGDPNNSNNSVSEPSTPVVVRTITFDPPEVVIPPKGKTRD